MRIFAHAHNGTLPSPFFPPHWFQEEANNQWVAYARAKKKVNYHLAIVSLPYTRSEIIIANLCY